MKAHQLSTAAFDVSSDCAPGTTDFPKNCPMRYLQTSVNFLRELRGNFGKIGAVLPSSRFLAKAMTQPLREPARIRAVGAGTGAIRGEIVRCLRPDDQFDTVEINNRFVEILQRRLATDWGSSPQLRIIHGPIEGVVGDGCSRYIISCLP